MALPVSYIYFDLTCDVCQRPLRVNLRLVEVDEANFAVNHLVRQLLPPQPHTAPLGLVEVIGHKAVPLLAHFSTPLNAPNNWNLINFKSNSIIHENLPEVQAAEDVLQNVGQRDISEQGLINVGAHFVYE